MKTSSASFRLPDSLPRRPAQWPAIACIAGIAVTSVVALDPSVGNSWSEVSYPVIAQLDQKLAPLGISVGPTPECNLEPPVPMIAVVFGCISADDSEPEPLELPSVKLEPTISEASIIRPAGYTSRRSREASEADELLQ